MASEESKMSDKEWTSVRGFVKESLKSDILIDISWITKVTVLERLKKDKENEHHRYLVVVGRPGRIVTVKSKMMGKSIESNILVLGINRLRYFEHRHGTLFCCELLFNDSTSSLVICTVSPDAMHQILERLCSVIHSVGQCVLFTPKLIDVPDAVSPEQRQLTESSVLSMAYQMLCIVEGIAIDSNLLRLFNDDQFHSVHRVFDVNSVLKRYALSAPQSAKHGVNPVEVMRVLFGVVIHSAFSFRFFS